MRQASEGLISPISSKLKSPQRRTLSMAYRWDLVKTALERYKQLNGNLLVPYEFVIPLNSTDYPVELN